MGVCVPACGCVDICGGRGGGGGWVEKGETSIPD